MKIVIAVIHDENSDSSAKSQNINSSGGWCK